MDLMAPSSELITTTVVLVMKPFSLLKLACLFGMRTAFIIIRTWIEVIRAAICFHLSLLSRGIIFIVALIFLPVRILNALQREKQLELYLHDMLREIENLVWDRKELQEHLQAAIKERQMMDMILSELEEEYESATAKIEQLEGEFQDLKNENLRLKEVQFKEYWRSKGPNDTGDGQNRSTSGIPRVMAKESWGDEGETETEHLGFLEARSISSGSVPPINPEIIPRQSVMNGVLYQRREVALLQSLFSAVLSLLVGMIIWEAEDPCMPLLVALFIVVGMSLKSVVDFFFTINNKPASDAVALLSFNCFILGMLTYPALPRVATMLAPPSTRMVNRVGGWLWSLLSLA